MAPKAIRGLMQIYYVRSHCVRHFQGEKKGQSICPQGTITSWKAIASTAEKASEGPRLCVGES